MASDLSKLDLLAIQIDGLHIGNDLVLVAALGIDAEGHKLSNIYRQQAHTGVNPEILQKKPKAAPNSA
jgi:hypothetical protein